jgi:hypothetical protein
LYAWRLLQLCLKTRWHLARIGGRWLRGCLTWDTRLTWKRLADRRWCGKTDVCGGGLTALFTDPKAADHQDTDQAHLERAAKQTTAPRPFHDVSALIGQRQRRSFADENMNIRTLWNFEVHHQLLEKVRRIAALSRNPKLDAQLTPTGCEWTLK